MTKEQIIEMMREAKAERVSDISKLKSDIKTGNADEENYDSLRMVISERYSAKMEVLEKIGLLV